MGKEIKVRPITKEEADKMFKTKSRLLQRSSIVPLHELYVASGRKGENFAREVHRVDVGTGEKTLIFRHKDK